MSRDTLRSRSPSPPAARPGAPPGLTAPPSKPNAQIYTLYLVRRTYTHRPTPPESHRGSLGNHHSAKEASCTVPAARDGAPARVDPPPMLLLAQEGPKMHHRAKRSHARRHTQRQCAVIGARPPPGLPLGRRAQATLRSGSQARRRGRADESDSRSSVLRLPALAPGGERRIRL